MKALKLLVLGILLASCDTPEPTPVERLAEAFSTSGQAPIRDGKED